MAQERWNGGSVWADAIGTRRRLQALAADGWSTTQLAARLGVTKTAIHQLAHASRPRVLTATAAAVSHLYDDCWWRTPPTAQRYQDRAAAAAQRHGWVESWRWHGRNLDDPAATPAPLAAGAPDELLIEGTISGHDHGRLPKAERRAVTAGLTVRGHSAEQIARLVHVSARTVERDRGRAAA